jgi:DNA-binding MurR/RpiR family transcriptional regulator
LAKNLIARLSDPDPELTAAERAIASYILANRQSIAYDTAVSLAKKLDVSSVTVGRFCRRLGYENFRALKADLKLDSTGVPWLVGSQLEAFVERSKSNGKYRTSLEMDVAGLVDVYTMAETPKWKAIVKLLAESGTVHVVGFQTERALASLLLHFLQYVRPDVHYADMTAGNYADVLLNKDKNRCVVIVETRRYSRHAVRLAEQVSARGIPLIVLTDKYCDWAAPLTPHVIAVSTDSDLFWNSEVPLTCAVNLLANAVVAHLGPKVESRLEQFSELYQDFTGHVGKPRKPRTAALKPG